MRREQSQNEYFEKGVALKSNFGGLPITKSWTGKMVKDAILQSDITLCGLTNLRPNPVQTLKACHAGVGRYPDRNRSYRNTDQRPG